MNIQQLEYIIAVDQFKSFSVAAAHCYVTQANLSAMVKKLEVELDTILFDRRAKSVITTDAGIEIIEEAKKIVQQSQLLIDKAKKINKTIKGQIRVGILPTLSYSLLPMITDRLSECYPELNLEVFNLTTEEIIKQVKDGCLDIGILATPDTPQEIGKVILFHEALMAYGDAYKDAVWLYDEGQNLKKQFVSLVSSKEKVQTIESLKLDPALFDLLLNRIDELGGSTLISELCYQMLSEDRKERVFSLRSPTPVREISMVFHKKYTNGKIVQALANLIRSNINDTLKAHHFSIQEMDILSV